MLLIEPVQGTADLRVPFVLPLAGKSVQLGEKFALLSHVLFETVIQQAHIDALRADAKNTANKQLKGAAELVGRGRFEERRHISRCRR